jgi:NTP pyrophosphatase (non-canonical NTP hydrolase)
MSDMTFDEYQKQSKGTAQFSDFVPGWVYLTLGLAGESGEVVDKIKKIVRNDNGVFSDDAKLEIKKELGDVLWYISQLCEELGLSMGEVAELNRAKLEDRKARDVIKSRGDNR